MRWFILATLGLVGCSMAPTVPVELPIPAEPAVQNPLQDAYSDLSRQWPTVRDCILRTATTAVERRVMINKCAQLQRDFWGSGPIRLDLWNNEMEAVAKAGARGARDDVAVIRFDTLLTEIYIMELTR